MTRRHKNLFGPKAHDESMVCARTISVQVGCVLKPMRICCQPSHARLHRMLCIQDKVILARVSEVRYIKIRHGDWRHST